MHSLKTATLAVALGAGLAAGTPAAAQTAPATAKPEPRLALVVRLEAKPGKAEDLAAFLRAGRAIVAEEMGTATWYAVRLGPTTFGIFDSFGDEAGRQAHLTGRIPAALGARAGELLASAPVIEPAEILASK